MAKGANNLEKKNKVWEVALSNIKIYYEVILIKTVSYEHKDKQTDQWNRIKVPKTRTKHVWNLNIWQRQFYR